MPIGQVYRAPASRRTSTRTPSVPQPDKPQTPTPDNPSKPSTPIPSDDASNIQEQHQPPPSKILVTSALPPAAPPPPQAPLPAPPQSNPPIPVHNSDATLPATSSTSPQINTPLQNNLTPVPNSLPSTARSAVASALAKFRDMESARSQPPLTRSVSVGRGVHTNVQRNGDYDEDTMNMGYGGRPVSVAVPPSGFDVDADVDVGQRVGNGMGESPASLAKIERREEVGGERREGYGNGYGRGKGLENGRGNAHEIQRERRKREHRRSRSVDCYPSPEQIQRAEQAGRMEGNHVPGANVMPDKGVVQVTQKEVYQVRQTVEYQQQQPQAAVYQQQARQVQQPHQVQQPVQVQQVQTRPQYAPRQQIQQNAPQHQGQPQVYQPTPTQPVYQQVGPPEQSQYRQNQQQVPHAPVAPPRNSSGEAPRFAGIHHSRESSAEQESSGEATKPTPPAAPTSTTSAPPRALQGNGQVLQQQVQRLSSNGGSSTGTLKGNGSTSSVEKLPLRPLKIFVIYYSLYGHIKVLADCIREGIESVSGCKAQLYRVPETLDSGILKKMRAPSPTADPIISYDMLNILEEADGILFGIPTRFGMMPAQMKALFDATGKLWQKGRLVGKPAGLFFSTATQGGGQETTALTTITQLTHHGMIYVPIGYSFGGAMFDNKEVHGGSPYGAGTIANGDGSRIPSEYELSMAAHQGASFANVARKLAS